MLKVIVDFVTMPYMYPVDLEFANTAICSGQKSSRLFLRIIFKWKRVHVSPRQATNEEFLCFTKTGSADGCRVGECEYI